MSFKVKGEVKGLQQVVATLEKIKRGARNRILKRAMMLASKPILDAAKDKAPKEFGLLKRSIKRKVIVDKKTGTVRVLIGPAKGYGKVVKLKPDQVFREVSGATRKVTKPTAEQREQKRDPVHYAHLVELGTVKRQAKPFLRPALDDNAAKFVRIMADVVREEIEKLARKK
jgi:HK97 gp10 family phage protein